MTNYTTFLIANDQMNILKSSIEGPRIGLCATNMTLAESKVDASGHGCLSDEGLGAGSQTGECAGSGGALGGQGGYGGLLEHVQKKEHLSECKKLATKPNPFGKSDQFEGSGGGSGINGAKTGGRGGGIIRLSALHTMRM